MRPREAIPELPLSELGTVFTGRTPPSEVASYFGSGCPFITPTDMTGQKYIRQAERELSPEGEALLARIVVPARSVMVSCIGWQMGKSAMTDRPSVTNQQLNTVVPNERVDADYLYYALTTRRDELKRLGSVGTRTPIVNKSVFSALRIPVPPLRSQRRIAGILSAYDDLIENCERRIRVLDEMARALYREWFVAPNRKSTAIVAQRLIDDGVLEINDGYRAKNSELGPPGIPFARAGNINDGFHFDEADVLSLPNVARAGTKVSRAEDILFTSKGTVGRFAKVREGTPRFVYSPQLCFWRVLKTDRLSPDYLFRWMQSREFLDQVDVVKGSTDMADYVSLTNQRRMVVRVPPVAAQQRADHAFRPIDGLIGNLTDRRAALKKARDLLLPRLVSGELSVDDAA